MKFTNKLALALVALAAPIASADAQTTVYQGFDQGSSARTNSDAASAQFQSALSGVGTESFEGFATNASAPLTLNFAGSGGSVLSATLTGGGGVRSGPNGVGGAATDGSKYYEVTSGNFVITFNSPVAAFGFYSKDIESDVQLIFTHTTGVSETFSFDTLFPTGGSNALSGSTNFLGFINTDNPFTSVTFGQGANSGGDVLAFDQMTIGDARQVTNPPGAVPEPATWAMMIVGFGAVGSTMRRRRGSAKLATA